METPQVVVETMLRIDDMYAQANQPAPLGATDYIPMIS